MKKAVTIILQKVKDGSMEVEEALELINAVYSTGADDLSGNIDSIIRNFETKARSFFDEAKKNTDEWVDFSRKAVSTLKKDLNDFVERSRTSGREEKDVTGKTDKDSE